MDNKDIGCLGKQEIYERIIKCGIVDKIFLVYLLFKGVCEGTAIEKVKPFVGYVLQKYLGALGHCSLISAGRLGEVKGMTVPKISCQR